MDPVDAARLPRAATAAVLVVGNEILSGKIEEKNLHVLATFLRGHGIELRRVEMVLDEIDAIASATRALASSHDWLFTSGGVGPTHDDVTIESVARAFDAPMVEHPELRRMLEAHYGERINEGHLRMALVPEGATLEATPEVRWPVVRIRNVWMLPGIPEIFRMKMAVLRERLPAGVAYVTKAVVTAHEESDIKPLLDDVVARFPDIAVGSYPKWAAPDPDGKIPYRTKVTFDGRDESRVEAAKAHFELGLRARFG